MEIADIFVVNKADLPGVENTERALRGSLNLAHPVPHQFIHHGKLESVVGQAAPGSSIGPEWVPPILRTVALDGNGIPGLAQAILDHRRHLQATGGWEARERWRLHSEFDLLLQNTLIENFKVLLADGAYEQALDDILARHLSPFEAVAMLVDGAYHKGQASE
jgi:LAO/AO transport system kinase